MNCLEKITNEYGQKTASRLEQFVKLIEEENKKINLTSFEGQRLWQEGIYESIKCLEPFVKSNDSLLDIGAGVGFPSVPFLIVNPEVKLTIIESNKKRVLFLEKVKKDLNLSFEIFNGRVENFNKEIHFDFITARALAPLNILMELTINLGSILPKLTNYIFVKGANYLSELNEAQNAIKILKLKVFDPKKIDVFFDKNIFMIHYIKTANVSKEYPRAWDKIIKKPIR
ncbi:16S rRNA (guanine(527)-N(7))-methyltransferase RsmG [Mycoplasmopsis pulmonis]|uniref:16S rRNA (guanine(527)-N(7))-methyltransferase RsmG n=1 Tax=Mycoplasmopsis pulmonis TaxID=2107 RepID=UPI00100510C7|nr:16S rRNA (guanine(527)-N(7))-methyltransferase RsmG [Mycoplasmopsis pulmonis]VEU67893.1 glucose-inhibited division protein B [Mycoplasmopsis pulmonis]